MTDPKPGGKHEKPTAPDTGKSGKSGSIPDPRHGDNKKADKGR